MSTRTVSEKDNYKQDKINYFVFFKMENMVQNKFCLLYFKNSLFKNHFDVFKTVALAIRLSLCPLLKLNIVQIQRSRDLLGFRDQYIWEYPCGS